MALQPHADQKQNEIKKTLGVGGLFLVISAFCALQWLGVLGERPSDSEAITLDSLVLTKRPVEELEGKTRVMHFQFSHYASDFKVREGHYDCCRMNDLLEHLNFGDTLSILVARNLKGEMTDEIYAVTLRNEQYGSLNCIRNDSEQNGFYGMIFFLLLGLSTMGYGLYRIKKENIALTE